MSPNGSPNVKEGMGRKGDHKSVNIHQHLLYKVIIMYYRGKYSVKIHDNNEIMVGE